jgi:hypothetical protein
MTQRHRQEAALNALRMIPAKLGIAIVALLIGYVLLQPKLNEWFGLSLPSLSSATDQQKPTSTKATVPKKSERDSKSDNETKSAKSKSAEKEQAPAEPEGSSLKPNTKASKATPAEKPSKTQAEPDSKSSVSSKSPAKTGSGTEPKTAGDSSNKKFGLLVDMGRERYKSPEGLIYGPGSEEGHRLKHIERHLEDQPNRPGSHGVFEGEMKAFLEAIDDAYARAKKGAKGTKKTNDEDAIVYEASFDKAIGFLGGQEGKRKRNPALKKLRIVVRGESVITAFPF